MTKDEAIKYLKKNKKRITFDNVLELTMPDWYKKLKGEIKCLKKLKSI